VKRAADLSQFNEGAVQCRSFGHAWKAYTAEKEGKGRAAGWNVTLVCANDCGTFKHFQLSQRGEYGHPHYSYADGYLASFYVGPDERAALRLEALSGVLPAIPKLRSVG
jgi:hypothetical protein